VAADRRAYEEIIDLFARGTSSADVLAFRPSEESQERVRYLLANNKSVDLTEYEVAELERFCELEHLMQLLKARAHLYVRDNREPDISARGELERFGG